MVTKQTKKRVKSPVPRYGPYDSIPGKRLRLKRPPTLESRAASPAERRNALHVVKDISLRVKPFHRPSSQTPALALVKTAAQAALPQPGGIVLPR